MATTKLVTAQDLWELDPGEQRYDLIRGELIEMSPASARHGEIAMTIGGHLWSHVRALGIGKTYGAETGFILARDPDIVLAPDAAYIRLDRLPAEIDQDRFLELAPDLVVEVVSPSDRSRDISDKVMEYLGAGVQLVWLIEPRRKLVTVYTPDRKSSILTVDDELDGGEVLPGFRIHVADIFR